MTTELDWNLGGESRSCVTMIGGGRGRRSDGSQSVHPYTRESSKWSRRPYTFGLLIYFLFLRIQEIPAAAPAPITATAAGPVSPIGPCD